MKILFYLKDLTMGGVQKRSLRLMKAILDNSTNISIELVLKEIKGELLASIDDRITLYYIDPNFFNRRFSFFKLGSLIIKNTPDVIVAGFGQLSIIALLAIAFYRLKTKVILIQALPIRLPNAPFSLNFKRVIGTKLFYPHIDRVVTVSKGVAKSVSAASGKLNHKIVTIYNPVVESGLIQKANEDNKHPFFESDIKIVISVGRLTEQKDFPTLIKAFSIVKNKYSKEVKLIILGDGYKRSSLEKLIHELDLTEDVSLPGFVDNPYSYMKKSSVFVLSSLWEGFGNVLVEAMALGLPVVSTNCEAGPDEILENGKIGELVPVKDEIAMSKAIINQLRKPDMPEILIKRANDFTLEKSANEYIKMFNAL